MAITSELIGKLGGGGVAEIPISATGLAGYRTNHRLATVEASGRTLVVFDLDIKNASTDLRLMPEIYIGDTFYTRVSSGEFKNLKIVNTDIDIKVITNSPIRVDFHGTIYAAEL